jgi:hypothetical protein
VAAYRAASDALIAAVERLREEDLVTPGRFPGTSEERPPWRDVAGNSWMHTREHSDLIRAS